MNAHVAKSTWSDPDAAVAFLKGLRPAGPWNLTAIVPDVQGAESATFTDPRKARAWIAQRTGRANCYFMPNPATRPSGAAGRANKGDVPDAHFVHVDLDLDKLPEDHELHPFPLADRKARVAAQLAALASPGPPSTVVDTGGGLQALWTLDPPLADIGLAERMNEQMLTTLPGGDPGTHNVDRLLRLPGTVNIPDARKRARGRTKAPARLLHTSANSYVDIEFEAAPKRARAEVDIMFDAPVFTGDLAGCSI